MEIKLGSRAAALVSIFFIVAGWVFLSNLPRHTQGTLTQFDRWSQVDYASWEPWSGIVLLSLGVGYFVLRFLPEDLKNSK